MAGGRAHKRSRGCFRSRGGRSKEAFTAEVFVQVWPANTFPTPFRASAIACNRASLDAIKSQGYYQGGLRGFAKGRKILYVNSDPAGLRGDNPWRRGEAAQRWPPRVWVETPKPPVLGKEPVSRKCADFRLEPDSMCESGFLFWGERS